MNQDYSPQIPDLTPASMKNEGVLRRLVNHLRSLTLFAGEGIKISRQGYGTTISLDTEPVQQGGSFVEANNGLRFSYSGGTLTISRFWYFPTIDTGSGDATGDSREFIVSPSTYYVYAGYVVSTGFYATSTFTFELESGLAPPSGIVGWVLVAVIRINADDKVDILDDRTRMMVAAPIGPSGGLVFEDKDGVEHLVGVTHGHVTTWKVGGVEQLTQPFIRP